VTRLTGSSAVLLVSDIGRAVDFWRDRLGFSCEVYGSPPHFASAVATRRLSCSRYALTPV